MTNDTKCGIIATVKEVKTLAIDYDKLKSIRSELGYTHAEMAELLGIPLRVYRSYEYGERDVNTETILKICKTFNVSADELLGMAHADSAVRNDIKIINGKIIYLTPIYELTSNFDSEPVDRMPGYFDTLKKAKATIAVKYSGDDMYPKIEDGDIAIINKLEHGRHGDIVLANVNGKNVIKRKITIRDNDKLESINPNYPPIDIKKAEQYELIGVVKTIIRNV